MSGSSTSQNTSTTKATTDDSTSTPSGLAPTELQQKKQQLQLEEDDEFEDFPMEDWPDNETTLPEGNQHLWEESWDDDDTSEDFAVMLKEELKKVDQNGKR